MTVYAVDYFKKNPTTKRKMKVTKFRGQVKHGGKTYTKLFDYRSQAESWVQQKSDDLSGMAAVGRLIEESQQITMGDLLREHFQKRLATHSASSFKSSQNRCLRAIPNVRIPYQLISKRITNYVFTNEFKQALMKEFLSEPDDYIKNGIPFGEFVVKTVDMQLISAYIQVRKVKANTLLRELTTISGAFTHSYKYFKEFENGLENPVKKLPRGDKPKPDNNRKTVINEEQTKRIAEYLAMKANQEPYYCFIQCIYSGCRRVECLSMEWQNINWEQQSFLVPKTKNGKPREVPIEPSLFEYLKSSPKNSGKVFKLTFFNMRAYWVEATKQLGYYDNERERLYFHDTRRTAITNNLRLAEGNNFQLAKVFGVKTTELEKQKNSLAQDISIIIRKLQQGEKLTPKEISLLAGHSSTNMTNDVYNADR